MFSKLIIILSIIILTKTTEKTNNVNNVINITLEYLKNKPFEKSDYLLFFGSPKCPFCMKMLPTWKTLADLALIDNIKTGAINCLFEKNICESFKIKQFPTIYLVKENFFYKFDGKRSLKNFVNFYKEKFKDINAKSFDDIMDLKDDDFGTLEVIKEIIKASPMTLIKIAIHLIYFICIIGGYFLFFTFYDCLTETKKLKSSKKKNRLENKDKDKNIKKKEKME